VIGVSAATRRNPRAEGGYSDYWWVKIVAGADQGWVSAVLITGGNNNQPITGVDPRPTVFA